MLAEQLRTFLRHLPTGVLVVDAQLRPVLANDAAIGLLGPGVDPASPTGEVYRSFVADTDDPYPDSRLPLRRALRGESVAVDDVEIQHPQGRLSLEVLAAPIHGDHGEVEFAVASFRDVTDHRLAEISWRDSQDAYRIIVENSPAGIYKTTPKGDILFVNPALLELLGYPSFNELRFWNLEREGSHASYDRHEFKKTLEENGEIRNLESPWRRRDGTLIWLSETVKAIRNRDGEVAYYEGVIVDISERKRAEEELRDSRERYRHIVDNATDAIYRCDPHGHFTFANAGTLRLTGYSFAELMGKQFADLIEPSQRAAVAAFYGEQFRKRIPNTYYEFAIVTKQGETIWVGQNTQSLLDGDWVLGFEVVARDISQTKEAEADLAKARDTALESARLKSEFLANISHEIRTPMNGVIGMTGLLLNTSLTAEQREIAETVRTSAESLLTLVNEILDFSKIEAGKITIEPVDFDLDAVVEGVTEVFLERATAKRLNFRTLVYPDVRRRLHGDALRLRQVLLNLVGNAIKFTDTGEVTVSVMQQRDSGSSVLLTFLVNDTGIGIAEEAQQRLFTPFAQADGTTTRRFGGTGLGLAISKQLVEMMAGQIGVASAPGEGSTFWFTLPLQKQEGPDLIASDEIGARRALVIDPNEVNRLALRRQLASSGIETVDLADPELAVARISRAMEEGKPFDVIIFEMQMSPIDGLSLARMIRADRVTSEVPLVLVTRIGRRQSDVEAFQAAGIDAFVLKPVRRATLISAVTAAVRKAPWTLHSRPDTTPLINRRARILLVEDNIVNQKVAVGQLRDLSYEVDVVGNGLEAVAAFRKQQFDLILMDCQMPVMDGYEAATEIRRLEASRRRTPIIAMTAHALEGERDRCLLAGMDDYLAKPVSQEKLRATLERWLGGGGSQSREVSDAPLASEKTSSVDHERVRSLMQIGRTDRQFISGLMNAFRQDVPVRLDAMREALAARDREAFARASHALKSSSGNVGASRMHHLCAEAEARARAGNGWVEIGSRVLEELQTEFMTATKALEQAMR